MTKGKDILVIDDEQVIRDAVVKICALDGFDTDTVESGRAGLELCEKNRYRLIVCDIMMQDVDGFQFLGEMRKRKIATPVIMATGYATVENAVKSLYAGAIDFIPKPFTTDELIAAVQRGLRHTELLASAAAGDPLVYVTSPATYYRLGYISWVMMEREGTVLVGVTDLFLKTIESVRGIELLSAGDEVVQGNSCAKITCGKERVNSVMCPVSGKIMEVNGKVTADPTVIEKDPYFEGWLYRILPEHLEYDLKNLISCSSDR